MKIAESQNLEPKKENVLLANAVVELVSVANVPVQAKEKFYGGLNSLSIINEKVGEGTQHQRLKCKRLRKQLN